MAENATASDSDPGNCLLRARPFDTDLRAKTRAGRRFQRNVQGLLTLRESELLQRERS